MLSTVLLPLTPHPERGTLGPMGVACALRASNSGRFHLQAENCLLCSRNGCGLPVARWTAYAFDRAVSALGLGPWRRASASE